MEAPEIAPVLDSGDKGTISLLGDLQFELMRSQLYYCRMSRCLTEIVWREDGQPICFWGKSGNGNVCDEPDGNFVLVPLEPLLWRTYGLLKRMRLIK